MVYTYAQEPSPTVQPDKKARACARSSGMVAKTGDQDQTICWAWAGAKISLSNAHVCMTERRLKAAFFYPH